MIDQRLAARTRPALEDLQLFDQRGMIEQRDRLLREERLEFDIRRRLVSERVGVPDAVLTDQEDRFQKQVSHGIMRRLVQIHAAAKSLVCFLYERSRDFCRMEMESICNVEI